MTADWEMTTNRRGLRRWLNPERFKTSVIIELPKGYFWLAEVREKNMMILKRWARTPEECVP